MLFRLSVLAVLAAALSPRIVEVFAGSISSSCPDVNSIERVYWKELSYLQRRCLETRTPNPFTEAHWDCGWTDEDFVPWSDLPERRREALLLRRYTELEWEERRTSSNPCQVEDDEPLTADPEDFDKLVVIRDTPPLAALADLSLDKLAEMYHDVPMRLVDGNGGAYSSEEFLAEMTIGQFVQDHIKKGDASRYLHLEEYMSEKKTLWEGVGKKAVAAIKDLVSHHPLALEKGGVGPQARHGFGRCKRFGLGHVRRIEGQYYLHALRQRRLQLFVRH